MVKKLNKSTHSPIKRNVLQHKINRKKLKPGLVAFYDIRPGNGAGLFSKEKVSQGGDKEGKSEEKRISGEAYDIKTHTHTHPFNSPFSIPR